MKFKVGDLVEFNRSGHRVFQSTIREIYGGHYRLEGYRGNFNDLYLTLVKPYRGRIII